MQPFELSTKKEKNGKSRKSSTKALYFFFATFFAFFLAALANALTSELIIGLNSYLKFAKDFASCLIKTKSNAERFLETNQSE